MRVDDALWEQLLDGAGAITLVLALCACGGGPGPKPGPPVPDTAGTPEECAYACDNLARLQCPGHEGSPGEDGTFGTADDVSCTQACIDIVTADSTVTLHQRCVAEASSCDGADQCLAEGE